MRHVCRVIAFFLAAIFCVEDCNAIDKNPQIGSFPSKKMNISFLFEEDNKVFFPQTISYKGGEGIELFSFPSSKIKVFVKVEQGATQEEGAVMYKLKRVYRSEVMRERREVVLLWVGRNFYKKEGVIGGWKATERRDYNFKLKQVNDYSSGTQVDGITSALSVAWDQLDYELLSNDEIRKHLEFPTVDDRDKSLLTIGFIHFAKFSGTRWIPINVPISDEPGNLKNVYLDLFIIKGKDVQVVSKYWIGVD